MATITIKADKGELARVTAMKTISGLTTPVEIGMIPSGENAEFVIEAGVRYIVQSFPNDWQARAEQASADSRKLVADEMKVRHERMGITEKRTEKEKV